MKLTLKNTSVLVAMLLLIVSAAIAASVSGGFQDANDTASLNGSHTNYFPNETETGWENSGELRKNI